MTNLQLVGRKGSHFTRVAAMFAIECGVPVERVHLRSLTSLETSDYGGHPALKIPTLLVDSAPLFGTENICRRLAQLGSRRRIIWLEDLPNDVTRNAQELTWHAMSAQVQLIIGTAIGKLPADNIFFSKITLGLNGALTWLNANVDRATADLPDRDLSLLEVSMFCLVEHLIFRPSVSIGSHHNLVRFAREFGQRPSAQQTQFA